MQQQIRRFWPIFAILTIVILGAVLRIAPLMQRDYWYDESFTGVTVRQDLPQMMDIVTNDVHPPMYYWLLKGWTLLAGSEPEMLRAFSVVFGVALVLLTFIALRQWVRGSWTPAIVGAFIVAINPFFVNYSQEARMYSLMAFLLLLAAVLLTRAWETKSTGVRIAYGVTLLAIVLTHYLGAIFALAFVAADFVQHFRTRKSVPLKQHAIWLFAGYLVPLLGGLAWLPYLRQQAQAHSSLGWVPNTLFEGIPVVLHAFLFGAPVGVAGVPPALGYRLEWLTVPSVSLVLVILFAVLATWLTLRKKWDTTLALLAFLASGPLLLTWLIQSIGMQLFVSRFLTGSALFLALFIVVAATKMHKGRSLTALAAIYALFVLLIQPWTYQAPIWPDIAQEAKEHADERAIVFTNAFDYTQGRFYLGESYVPQIRIYNVNNPEEYLGGWAMVAQDTQVFALPEEPHIVVTAQPEEFASYEVVATVDAYSIMQSM